MAQTQTFTGTARAIHNTDGAKNYLYHKTAVVKKFDNGDIQLNSGGWKTRTTLRAMNQASNQDNLGFRVYQRKFEWYVLWNGVEHNFTDDMILKI